MNEVWPFDVNQSLEGSPREAIRPFRCLLLMPFQEEFREVTAIIHDTVAEVISQFPDFPTGLPVIERLDMVDASGAIQQQIWQKILEADLVICDITGYNANVMFESGVCAAWKPTVQVVLIKAASFKTEAPFDIKPMRYTEYELSTYTGSKTFKQRLTALIRDAVIAFPDGFTTSQGVPLPFARDFEHDHDDLTICTSPFAHRRLVRGALEFGSPWVYSHSWATIGKERFHHFALEFSARFSNPVPGMNAFIGVGVRSQHYFANFAHVLYLNRQGNVIITQPDDEPPKFYRDVILRDATPIDITAAHEFRVRFDDATLEIKVDEFAKTVEVAAMKKVLGPGLIRFQAYGTWMALQRFSIARL